MWFQRYCPWVDDIDDVEAIRRTRLQLMVVSGVDAPAEQQDLATALVAALRKEHAGAWTLRAAVPPAQLVPEAVFVYLRKPPTPDDEVPGRVFGFQKTGETWTARPIGYQPARLDGGPRYGPGPRPAPEDPEPPSPRVDLGWKPILEAFCTAMAEDGMTQGQWTGRPPATPAAIAATEARLGFTLPPSVRAFYELTNGFGDLGPHIPEIRPVEQIDWTRDSIGAIGEIIEGNDTRSDDDDKIYQSVALSGDSDMSVVLLDPEATRSGGELAAMDFKSDYWGLDVYRSFRELIVDHLAKLEADNAETRAKRDAAKAVASTRTWPPTPSMCGNDVAARLSGAPPRTPRQHADDHARLLAQLASANHAGLDADALDGLVHAVLRMSDARRTHDWATYVTFQETDPARQRARLERYQEARRRRPAEMSAAEKVAHLRSRLAALGADKRAAIVGNLRNQIAQTEALAEGVRKNSPIHARVAELKMHLRVLEEPDWNPPPEPQAPAPTAPAPPPQAVAHWPVLLLPHAQGGVRAIGVEHHPQRGARILAYRWTQHDDRRWIVGQATGLPSWDAVAEQLAAHLP
jgi:hypothetical protein